MKLFNCIFYFLSVIALSQNTVTTKNQSLEDSISSNIFKSYKLVQEYKYKEASKQIISNTELAITLKNDSLTGKGYNALAYLNSHLNNETIAIKYYKKAEKLFIKNNNQKRLAITYNNLAHVYFEKKKDTAQSIYYIKKAILAYNSNPIDYWGASIAYFNLSDYLEKSNKTNKALIVLDSALFCAKKAKTKRVLSISHRLISKIYYKKENFNRALKHIDTSLKIAEDKNYKDVLEKLYKLKYTILKKQRKQKESLIYLEKYQDLITNIHIHKKSNTLKKIAAKFELKERDKLLENTISESIKNSNKLKKTYFYSTLIAISFIISILSIFIVYKNSQIRKNTANLLLTKNNELKKVQLKTELDLLKTQIQPHFFFKSLNSLRHLTLEKPNKGKDFILKLSDFMQYSLYGVKNKKNSILNEINNIQNYLTLAELYQSKALFSPIEIKGIMNDVFVPPLLFIQFIEKSLNYNDIDDFNLDISFQNVQRKYILFKIKKTIKSQGKIFHHKKNDYTEIENVKRRLDIIYNDSYKLDFLKDKNTYSIILKIPITTTTPQ